MKILQTMYYLTILTHIFTFVFTLLMIQDFSLLTAIPINFSFGSLQFKFTINLFIFIPVLLLIYALIAISGTSVLGSGLNDESVRIIRKISSAIIIYLIISIFTTMILSALPSLLQTFLNLFLILSYFLYVIQDSAIEQKGE